MSGHCDNELIWGGLTPVKVEEMETERRRLRAFFERVENKAAWDPAVKPELDVRNADHIACMLSEHLRIKNGHIEGIPFVAVQIAEAIDSLEASRSLLNKEKEGQ